MYNREIMNEPSKLSSDPPKIETSKRSRDLKANLSFAKNNGYDRYPEQMAH